METATSQYEIEERVCQAAVLYPILDFTQELPGVPPTLAPQIISTSGFGNTGRAIADLNTYRGEMTSSFARQAEVVIKSAFPNITFEEMQDWTNNHLMDYLARAEWALRYVHNIQLPFNDGSEEKQDETPPKDEKTVLLETAQKMRQEGIDPMLAFGQSIIHKEPYMEMPLIGGVSQWHNEVILNGIQQQIQKVSGR